MSRMRMIRSSQFEKDMCTPGQNRAAKSGGPDTVRELKWIGVVYDLLLLCPPITFFRTPWAARHRFILTKIARFQAERPSLGILTWRKAVPNDPKLRVLTAQDHQPSTLAKARQDLIKLTSPDGVARTWNPLDCNDEL